MFTSQECSTFLCIAGIIILPGLGVEPRFPVYTGVLTLYDLDDIGYLKISTCVETAYSIFTSQKLSTFLCIASVVMFLRLGVEPTFPLYTGVLTLYNLDDIE